MVAIRRLSPGDEEPLATLAREDAEFDVDGRGRAREPVDPRAAAEYLDDPGVLHWVAQDGGMIVGHLLCYVQRRRAEDPVQVMLYEIGVRAGHRRQGIGTALVRTMEEWMLGRGIASVWVPADNEGALAFYAACGFTPDELQPVQMSRRLRLDA